MSGSTKMHREGPAWQGNNTGRGSEPARTSKTGHRVEGTHISGEDDWGRKGLKSSARDKSSASRGPGRKNPY